MQIFLLYGQLKQANILFSCSKGSPAWLQKSIAGDPVPCSRTRQQLEIVANKRLNCNYATKTHWRHVPKRRRLPNCMHTVWLKETQISDIEIFWKMCQIWPKDNRRVKVQMRSGCLFSVLMAVDERRNVIRTLLITENYPWAGWLLNE